MEDVATLPLCRVTPLKLPERTCSPTFDVWVFLDLDNISLLELLHALVPVRLMLSPICSPKTASPTPTASGTASVLPQSRERGKDAQRTFLPLSRLCGKTEAVHRRPCGER